MNELCILPQDRPAHAGHPPKRDGDIVSAWNQTKIEWRNAQILTQRRLFQNNLAGLNPGVPQLWEDHTKEYRFERIGRFTVLRRNLLNGRAVELTHPLLPLFVQRRLSYRWHLMFGTERDREIWYAGREIRTPARLNALWTRIEEQTGYLRSEHQLKIWGDRELESFLVLPVQHISDRDIEDFQSPQKAANGEIVRYRSRFVRWRDLVSTLGVTEAQVTDRGTRLDLRRKVTALPTAIVRTRV